MKSLQTFLSDETNLPMVLLDEEAIEVISEAEEKKEDDKQLRHFDHAEDTLIRANGQGFNDMLSSLMNTHDYLSGGRKRPNFTLSMKMDGSPAVVWGHDPLNGKFFVGTKSFFNKTPKVNYSDKDIDTNHGHTPNLANRLKLLLQHLKGISPKKGVFQGDLMYTGTDVAEYDNKLSFTPNTITYNVDKDSSAGKKIMASKVGLAPHTEYERMPDGNMQAKFGVDLSLFKKKPDVNLIDTKVSGPFKYTGDQKKQFASHIEKIRELQGQLVAMDASDSLKQHEKLLLAYINSAIKSKKPNSVAGYIAFLNKQMTNRIDTVKQDSTKNNIRSQMTQELANVATNKKVFQTLFDAHKEVQKAKGILVNVLSSHSPYQETILGTPSKPEGFVASTNGKPVKLVDREHFSAANFDWNEKINPEHNPVVMAWGRFNPITKGHEKLINKAEDVARRTGAKAITRATRTKDGEKNPLTPQDKLKWMKTLFPGQDVALAGGESTTIIAQLQQLHHKGVRHVTLVAGADRVPEYTRILAKYNGPGKLFDFKVARVVSSGERDPDSDNDTTSVSASKARQHVKKNDYHSFKKTMPSKSDEGQSKEMFHTLRAEMGLVKIGPHTDAHALSIYAKRAVGDKVGNQARLEINRRKKDKK